MIAFEETAAHYDRFRTLPEPVPQSIRDAVRTRSPSLQGTDAGILEVGVGTGRIGLAFVEAGDAYVGADPSRAMLDQFAGKAKRRHLPVPELVQADGTLLPFAESTFGAVLIVQVLSGLGGWKDLLRESRRVLRPGGVLVLGQTIKPAGGVDDRMRTRLAEILAGMGVAWRRPGANREESRTFLSAEAAPMEKVNAASWMSARSPRAFLDRKAFGARFVALPEVIRAEALGQLAAWAEDTFGGLDVEIDEAYRFEVDFYALPS